MVRCRGVVARLITQAGVSADLPAATKDSTICGQTMQTHVKHQRAREARQVLVIERAAGLLRIFVPRDKRHRRGVLPMRERNPRVFARRHRRCDARHDFKRNPRGRECSGFLAAATEDKRIAPLQSHHGFARAGIGDQTGVDFLLIEHPPARSHRPASSLGMGLGMP